MVTFAQALDTSFVEFATAQHVPILTSFFLWITQLGDARSIIVVSVSIAIVLWRHKRWQYKVGFFLALATSLCGSYALKIAVERSRPLVDSALVLETGYSFPSMHAAIAFAVYGFLAYMVWKFMHPPQQRFVWIVFLSVLIVIIGFSRVYLGVHYASDVLAGFAVGALSIWLGAYITRRLLSRTKTRR